MHTWLFSMHFSRAVLYSLNVVQLSNLPRYGMAPEASGHVYLSTTTYPSIPSLQVEIASLLRERPCSVFDTLSSAWSSFILRRTLAPQCKHLPWLPSISDLPMFSISHSLPPDHWEHSLIHLTPCLKLCFLGNSICDTIYKSSSRWQSHFGFKLSGIIYISHTQPSSSLVIHY